MKKAMAEIIRLGSVDSTNEYILKEDHPEGTVVLADSQTKGRGRGEHSFASPEGGIYFSCLLKGCSEDDPPSYARLAPYDAALLTPKAAVAVCTALEELLGLEPGIKWVNDIFLGGKKVCGILCEHAGNSYVAGIGINVKSSSLPEELREKAGGICDGTEEPLSDEMKLRIAGRISDIIFSPMCADRVREEYEKRLIVKGKMVSFTLDGKEMTGIAEGINCACNLNIKTPGGTVTLSSGEIRLL